MQATGKGSIIICSCITQAYHLLSVKSCAIQKVDWQKNQCLYNSECLPMGFLSHSLSNILNHFVFFCTLRLNTCDVSLDIHTFLSLYWKRSNYLRSLFLTLKSLCSLNLNMTIWRIPPKLVEKLFIFCILVQNK